MNFAHRDIAREGLGRSRRLEQLLRAHLEAQQVIEAVAAHRQRLLEADEAEGRQLGHRHRHRALGPALRQRAA